MTFEAIYNIALEVANARAQSGEFIAPDETVCVIFSRTGRVYNGVSRMEMVNGAPMSVHAEIEAMRNMQTYGGETAVDSMVLIDTINRSPMLPCNGCVSYIVSMSPDNAMASVVMPDRMIPLSEIMGMSGGFVPNAAFGGMQGGVPNGMPNGMPSAAPVQSGFIQSGYVQSMQFGAAPVQSVQSPVQSVQSSSLPEGAGTGGTSKNDLLKNRVSSLMNAAATDEEEDDEFLQELGGKKKRGLFGLFN